MSRNANSRFALNPTNIDMQRSQFNMDMSHLTTFNVGELIPFYMQEVLPGDTHQIRTNKVVRMPSLVAPIFSNLYLDTYHFFVPARLCWEHWKEFMGENTQSAWIPQTEYTVPQTTAPEGGWSEGTIADYMGVPTGVNNLSVMSLPFRAYALICQEWFKDQNVMDPLNIPLDDSTVVGSNGDNYITDVVLGGKPFKVAKYHDYFTSALPSPQKGNSVALPVTFADVSTLPVSARDTEWALDDLYNDGTNAYSVVIRNRQLSNINGANFPRALTVANGSGNLGRAGVDYTSGVSTGAVFSNLAADASGLNLGIGNIADLRMAFQIQKLLEKDARGGTRYREILKSHFSVTSPDARMQVPEYLGGNRVPIRINQVVQSSGTTSESPQGNVAGYSLTADSHGDFIKSFTEHGFIIGVMCVRYDHLYQQGLNRMWSRKTRYDYYWPVLANLGEQAILNKEIFVQGTDQDEEVFGYQERWAEYRYTPSRVSGAMRSNYAQSLDVWHLGDDYSALPMLSSEWLIEDATTLDRVLAVSSEVSSQFLADIFIQDRATRPMPMYSIPGLIDHH